MVLTRFLKYIEFDTQSDSESMSVPSTEKQKLLGKYLVDEFHKMGITNAYLDEYGYVYAKLEAKNKEKPTIGFIAHLDTATEITGANVKARIIEDYDGLDIELDNGLKTKVEDFEFLSDLKGKTLVVTDGNTLLGADDKAGIAVIMQFVEELLHSDLDYGGIKIAFTPDEEIGRGSDHFNVEEFAADFAYTIDGGKVGGVDYQNFNAAHAKITITGVNIHPGDAKNKMVNPLNLAHEFHGLLNPVERPEHTEGAEGFYHLLDIKGDAEKAVLNYIIRDHDSEQFAKKKSLIKEITNFINNKYQKEFIHCEIEDNYYNMYQILKDQMHIVDLAKQAHKNLGIEAFSEAIRGGTDGARLTFMGLPTPNLGHGGYNFHGPHELLVVEELEVAVKVLLEIVKIA